MLSVLYGWSASRPVCFTLKKAPLIPTEEEGDLGPIAGVDTELEKNPPGHVAGRCTD